MSTSLRVLSCAALLLAARHAAAICPAFGYYRYVGDTATDSLCTDNDIQTAIDNASAVCRTNIVITNELAYTSQALNIDGKSIALEGVGDGIPCNYKPAVCDLKLGCGGGGAPPAPAVTIHGNGTASVIHIQGNSTVWVQALELTGGGGDYGGAIDVGGAGSLTLVDSSILSNGALYGGGILVDGSLGSVTLTLGAGTIIEENTAYVDGGGIYLGTTAHLLALAPYTFIGFNHAPNGHGGGLAMAGPVPTQADIGSPGYGGGAVIDYNDAAYGGGIALVAVPPKNQGYFLQARLFATDPDNPVGVSNNTATIAGGGVYIQPNWDAAVSAGIGADICAQNFRIDDNIAPEGSAIYADSYYVGATLIGGGAAVFNPDVGCSDNYATTTASLGAVICAPGVACNTVNGNAALDSNNQPTAGAAIFINAAGTLNAWRFMMRFNTGGNAVHLASTYSAGMIDCLLADNTVSGELIRSENFPMNIDSCTLANNAIGGASVIYSTLKYYPDERSLLQDSIVDQPGLVTLTYGDKSTVDAAYVLSNDISTLPYETQGEPTFVNAATGDYHLAAGSLGIDFAPLLSYGTATPRYDLDGVPRTFDIPTVTDLYGPRDLGAYERVPACYRGDTLFCDGFNGIY